MRADIDYWRPITLSEIYDVFTVMPIKWFIAGGWAIDLHLGKKSREHKDIDVSINRKDQLIVQQYLKKIGCYIRRRKVISSRGQKVSF